MELWGWGRKNTADVDADGRLKTSSATYNEDHSAALEGEGYVLDLDGVATNGAEHIFVIKNGHSTMNLVVTSITIWVAAFKDTTYVEANLNETFTYAAGGNAVVPVNLRSGKAGGAQGDFYTIAAGGTDITTFGGSATKGGRFIFTTTPLKWAKRSGWLIPPNEVFSLYDEGNDNTFRGYVSFYYHASH